MSSKNSCGPHTELVSNATVRVTRCACGIVHMTLLSNGVTVRMTVDAFRNAVSGIKAAGDKLDDQPVFGSTGSTTIN